MSASKFFTACVTLIALTVASAETNAQLFKKRAARNAQPRATYSRSQPVSVQNSPYNTTGRQLGKLGIRKTEKMIEKDTRVAERTGQSVHDVAEKRIRRIETFAAILGGAGAGLSGAADALSYSSPAPITTGGRSSALQSNFSQQMQWNAYNRSYSTNPWHAHVQ